MKQGTTYQKLGDICDVINGLWKGKKPPFINVGVIRNANFTKSFTLRYDNIEYLDVEVRQYEKRKLQKGDLIVEKSGGSEKQPVGRAVLFEREDGEFSFSNFTSILRIKDKDSFYSKFLFYFLLFIYKRGDTLGMQKATTGIHNIEFEKYLNICVPVISLAEQERIVERLDAAFAQIDELKSNAEKQLAEARALFQAALTQAMQPKTGWQDFSFSQIIKLKSGDNLPAKSFVEGAYPVYGGNGIAGYHNQYNKEGGQIVIGRVGALCGNVRFIKSPFWLTDNGFEVILNKEQKMDLLFLTYLLNFCNLRQYARQAAQPVISNVSLKDIQLSIPPIKEQQTIVAQLDALSNRIRDLEEINRKTVAECDALKQALLRQIFE